MILIANLTPVYVKELYTGKTRKFKCQRDADNFYGKKHGYMKDVRTKLNGKNKYYEVWLVQK